MQPTWGPSAEAYRAEIRSFLAEALPDGWQGIGALAHEDVQPWVDEWRATLADRGLLAPSWPAEFGGPGLSEEEQVILAEEFAKAGVPTGGTNDVFSIQMVGNTILQWGTEEQKREYIPKILSGEHVWCQGYSEPNAGSDLGNLGCRAVLDGDEWVINGQKIWTSAGHLADHIFVLARTDPDAPKHRGITFLLVEMDQPGVEVRPIRMMTGDSEFNEVFFSDARCPADNVIGEVNGGWPVAMTLLGYERGDSAATVPILFRLEYDRLVELARRTGASADPVVRQRLAEAYTAVEIMRLSGMRTLTAHLAGAAPGPEAGLFKLMWSEHHRRITELAVGILGVEATVPSGRFPASSFQTDDPGAPNDSASWVGTFMNARAGTIYAGSSEIQRNIIGEMVLGLPKEPRPDAAPVSWADEQAGRSGR